ncbi:MAG: hypothetical protein HOP11_07630 [Saprospiraceae bacterium]|nr:hypothetical protein [Saprospiraceae bacterium]
MKNMTQIQSAFKIQFLNQVNITLLVILFSMIFSSNIQSQSLEEKIDKSKSYVAGIIYIDTNKNGKLDENETALNGANIRLIRKGINKKPDQVLVENRTSVSGEYIFYTNEFPVQLVITFENEVYNIVRPSTYVHEEYGEVGNTAFVVFTKAGLKNIGLTK